MGPDVHDERGATAASLADDLRRKEVGLRLALEAGQMGSWEWDIRTGVIRWSHNLEAIHGMPPGSFGGTFDAFQTLIHPDDHERVLGAIRASVETRADYETEFRSADTRHGERWILGKGKVFTDEDGRPSLMMGICMDVTKRKLAERDLVEANRRKDEFLAMVSHELRNPLAAIMNASALIEHGTTTDPIASQASGTIRRQTSQLVRIVDDLLDVSRLTADKLTLQRTPLDLATVVERCVRDFVSRRLLDRHRHELRGVVTPVLGDGPRLEQIVSNLLTNAIKYTPAGGTIVVDVRPNGLDAVLSVKDSGIGIPAELLPRIFDLFVQSERGLDRPDGGLGLGLTIVHQLVTAHGGRIDARSAGTGTGTELVVRLPLVDARVPRREPGARSIAASPRQRILLIDDNVDAREAVAALLRIAGHEVYQASEAMGGMETAARITPDVAILDIGLPGLDGFELARRLKARSPDLRLVALTGYGQADHKRLGAQVGFEAYLVKPVGVESLLHTLATPPKHAPAA